MPHLRVFRRTKARMSGHANPAAAPPLGTCEDGTVSEQPSRYQRTTGGLVGALVITLVVIGGYVAFRAATRDDLDVKPQAVDYREAVQALRDAGTDVVHPRSVPASWTVTSVDSEPGRRLVWGMGMLTPTGFAGLREEDQSLDDLVATYVDEHATQGADVTVQGDLGGTWHSYSDRGGDHALGVEHGRESLLVYGSADVSDLRRLAESLTE